MDGEAKLVVKGELPQDRAGTRTMFDPSVSRWEIFSRNLIAGFGRALGGTVIYLAFLILIGSIVGQIIFPIFKPYIDSYMNILSSFSRMSTTDEPSMQIQERDSAQSTDINKLLSNPKVQDLLQEFTQ
jgi:hypothetical protein